MATPSTHEAQMSGLFAGHKSVQNRAKKRICCKPPGTQESEIEKAELWQEKLDTALKEFINGL